jgi:DNA-directed RNA polymerase specialized sigma24 family protein
MADGVRLLEALNAFERDGAFSEEDYGALRAAVADIGRIDHGLVDGFIGLFFERHVLEDARRLELLAMAPDELVRAIRHRFKQVVAGAHDSRQVWHALAAHVRDALHALAAPSPSFPPAIATASGFSAIAVEQAVGALWGELGRRPLAKEATAELLARYVSTGGADAGHTGSREYPAVVAAKLDAQRLARGVLGLLSDQEKALFRSQLDGEPVEGWAQANRVSRATAYRLLARLKALVRAELEDRSARTQLAALDVIRTGL